MKRTPANAVTDTCLFIGLAFLATVVARNGHRAPKVAL